MTLAKALGPGTGNEQQLQQPRPDIRRLLALYPQWRWKHIATGSCSFLRTDGPLTNRELAPAAAWAGVVSPAEMQDTPGEASSVLPVATLFGKE